MCIATSVSRVRTASLGAQVSGFMARKCRNASTPAAVSDWTRSSCENKLHNQEEVSNNLKTTDIDNKTNNGRSRPMQISHEWRWHKCLTLYILQSVNPSQKLAGFEKDSTNSVERELVENFLQLEQLDKDKHDDRQMSSGTHHNKRSCNAP